MNNMSGTITINGRTRRDWVVIFNRIIFSTCPSKDESPAITRFHVCVQGKEVTFYSSDRFIFFAYNFDADNDSLINTTFSMSVSEAKDFAKRLKDSFGINQEVTMVIDVEDGAIRLTAKSGDESVSMNVDADSCHLNFGIINSLINKMRKMTWTAPINLKTLSHVNLFKDLLLWTSLEPGEDATKPRLINDRNDSSFIGGMMGEISLRNTTSEELFKNF